MVPVLPYPPSKKLRNKGKIKRAGSVHV
jgi:hypothetical protein